MFTFNDFIAENRMLTELKELYGAKSLDEKQKDFLTEVFRKIMNTEFKNDTSGKLDLIGSIYEKTVDFEYRKILGEFYTPKIIVNHILESIGYSSLEKIRYKKMIDISCGSGSFLIESAKFLKSSLLASQDKKMSIELAKEIINEIRMHIYGIDLNPIACILCQLNLSKRTNVSI
jgi:type I restriction-modification system DNA methylase subunit